MGQLLAFPTRRPVMTDVTRVYPGQWVIVHGHAGQVMAVDRDNCTADVAIGGAVSKFPLYHVRDDAARNAGGAS